MSVNPESMISLTQLFENTSEPEIIFIKDELSVDRGRGGESFSGRSKKQENPISSSMPFCVLCLRECTPDVLVPFSDQPKPNHINATKGQQKLEQILGLALPLDDGAVCRTCWKLVDILKDFRESCLKAAAWTKRFSHGMKYDANIDSWLTPDVFHSMHAVHKAIRDNSNRIELEEVIAVNSVKIPEARKDPTKVESEVQMECKKCGQKVVGFRALRMHVERCLNGSKISQHTCSICNATFKELTGLKSHMNKHNGERPFKCRKFCDQTFFSNFVRIQHEKISCGVDGLIYSAGSLQSKNEVFLKRQIAGFLGKASEFGTPGGKAVRTGAKQPTQQQVHSDSVRTAHKASKDNRNAVELRQAIAMNPPESKVKKDGQKKPVTNVETELQMDEGLSNDVDVSNTQSSKDTIPVVALLGEDNHNTSILECEKCGRKIDGITAHRMHVERCVEGRNKTKYHTCSICNATFKDLCGVRFHMNKHNGVRPYKCRKYCDQTFSSNFVRIKHERAICEVDGRICPTCGAQLKNEVSLKRHIESVHGEAKHVCTTCGMAFRSRVRLRTHQRVHSDERKYPCKVCGKAYKSPYAVRVHMRFHTQEKPFHCHLCNEAFTYKVSMKNHIERHHGHLG